jgi:dTDP-4-dehydrorhamnose 3,5-epimerase
MTASLSTIYGVEVKELKSHPDDRGFFREIIRSTDPLFQEGTFGQWSHSRMQRDVVKAWHYHHVQTDWWYVPLGQIDTVLYDNREESPTFKMKMIIRMGESERYGSDTREVCVRIPPGVLHGCRVLSDEAHLFYITSHTYNAEEEGRFPYNSPRVDHDWGPNPITSEKDRRTFVPTSVRQLVKS